MTGWTPDVSQMTIVVIGVIQGAGLGFLFVPLSTVTLSTLPPEQRTEGAGLLQSVAQHRLQRRHLGGERPADAEHAGQSCRYRAARHRRQPRLRGPDDRAVLEPADRRRTRRARRHDHAQAQIIAYIDDYKLLMIATLAVIPLLIVFKQASAGAWLGPRGRGWNTMTGEARRSAGSGWRPAAGRCNPGVRRADA